MCFGEKQNKSQPSKTKNKNKNKTKRISEQKNDEERKV
jgi:hypothetical protein